ncbi:MAG TPA: hydrophobe/amphiphile efflux-1 family RND transporter, partial [Stenotrophomonas maltophilia]|nr:hydrophobe/amphiphile efflux-1 family RND transporter [Stenotrophomonas maltophilia]
YAMRIWLDPNKLHTYGLSVAEVTAAIKAQNAQVAIGQLGGAPSIKGQQLNATINAQSRLQTPEQFRNIIVRGAQDGAELRLGDVARVELGAESYDFVTRYNGQPASGLAVTLATGANALDTAAGVNAALEDMKSFFPAGLKAEVPYDTTPFVRVSIKGVVQTLIEAIVLVFVVMYLFLQNFRATLIPTLVIPVALLGTFLGMWMIGFTINQLTLFAMVLAIGIVVDDAIVVIENVERIMTEEGLAPKPATQKAMTQITGAVVAITVVLAAVFIPSALQGGAAGEIYKQFALTIAISMAFSAFLALGFTPALCATFLKPTHNDNPNIVYRTFNKYYDKISHTYVGHITSAVRHAPRWMILFVVLTALCGFLFTRMPGSFLPEEDQGYALAIVQLPPGSTKGQTNEVFAQMRGILEKQDGYEGMLQVAGFSFVGSGENVGMGFIRLKPWEERKFTAPEFIQNMNGAFYGIKEAQIFVVNLPTVQGLGQFGGFDMWLQDRSGAGYEQLTQARNILLGQAAQKPDHLVGVRPNGLENAPQLQLHVDRVQAQSMGMSVSDVYSTIQLMLAPVYVNDFFYEGRIKRVTMQADGPYRTGQESLKSFYSPSSLTRNADGTNSMIPLNTVVKSEWVSAPPSLSRYNGYSAINIVGSQAPGTSSGEAMQTMESIVNDDLPAGFGYDWSGMSYQEILAGNAATLLLVLSIVVVFLCLAALYESWSIPVAVLLVVPLGVLGALGLSMLRGLPNDLFFKIGLITVIGLAAKNAILIVEFAVEQRAAGKNLRDATIEAARLRFRPILMTSFAFIMGVIPMAISTGAGANSRHAIGTGVIGGMLFATLLGLLMIPVFFVVVRRMLGDKLDEPSKEFMERQRDADAAHRPDR